MARPEWTDLVSPDLLKRPVTVAIKEVWFGQASVELHCELDHQFTGDGLWVWMISTAEGGKRGRIYWAQARSPHGDPRAVRASFGSGEPVEDNAEVGFVVDVSRAGRRGAEGRSELVTVRRPGVLLTLGAPVVERLPR